MGWKRSRFVVALPGFAIGEPLAGGRSRGVARALPRFDAHGQPPDSRSVWSSLFVCGVDANPGAGSTGIVAICKRTSIKVRFE
jgi:hypothetical protein